MNVMGWGAAYLLHSIQSLQKWSARATHKSTNVRGFMAHLSDIRSEGLEVVEGPGNSPDDNGLPLDKLGSKMVATAPAICWIVSTGRLSLREAGVGKLTAVEAGGIMAVSAVMAGGGGGGGIVSLALDIIQQAAINNKKRETIKLDLEVNKLESPLEL